MNEFSELFLIFIITYLIGNISPAILIGKLYGIDIRKEGSGNAGTTNVMRVLGVKQGLLTLLIDVIKGFVSVKAGLLIAGERGAIVAFVAVVLGHCFPCLYHFSGGKGVATMLGCALALNWQSALIALAVAAVILFIFRMMAVASMTAVISYPILLHIFIPQYTTFAICMAVFVIFMHRGNIKRLIHGEEKKLIFKKSN